MCTIWIGPNKKTLHKRLFRLCLATYLKIFRDFIPLQISIVISEYYYSLLRYFLFFCISIKSLEMVIGTDFRQVDIITTYEKRCSKILFLKPILQSFATHLFSELVIRTSFK